MIFGSLLLVAAALGSPSAGVGGASKAAQFETRCGWFSNPTPANMWLYDREGEWTIGVQGGYQVQSDWEFKPDFKPRQWVKTNVGEYGYGCACFRLRVDKQNHEVLEISSARALPLATCRKDQALKQWQRKLD